MAATSSKLTVGGASYDVHRIDAIDGVERLPYTLRIVLENVLRDGEVARNEHGPRADGASVVVGLDVQ